MTPSTASTGAITLAGTLGIASGGTSSTTASGALTALGAQPLFTAQTANTVYAGPTTGASATPSFRALVSSDIPALPYGTGSVTSVGLALPASVFNVTGSPVTTTGTLTGTLATQPINTLFAGPASGSAGTPTFRALTSSDLPSLTGSAVTSLSFGTTGLTPSTASQGVITVAGTLAVGNGGTGLNTLATGYIPYGNGTGALSSISSLNFNATNNALNVPTLSASSSTSLTPTLTFNASNSNFSSGVTVTNSYLQALIQNKSGTASASTNYVLSNDLGTDSSYYGEFGMNSSGFSSSTPADFYSINNQIYFSGHDGDIAVGSGNGYKLYFPWGASANSAHVINASGAIGLSTNLGTTPATSGTTGFGTSGQLMQSAGSTAPPTWSSALTGLTIDNTIIGGTTPSTGTFTTITGQTLSLIHI